MKRPLVERIKYSPLSRLAASPMRTRIAFAPLLTQGAEALRWLVGSREWAAFTYDYQPEGLQAVICAVALLTGIEPSRLRSYAQELRDDEVFAARHRERVAHTRLRWTSDPQLRYGRFLVNYLLVRASGAQRIFEAGTERGLSTWAMCRALTRNGVVGNVAAPPITTVDIADDRGEFLDGDEGGLVRRLVGDSVQALHHHQGPIDLFLHDTVNEPIHTRAQLQALRPHLVPGSLIHACWFSTPLFEFCEAHGLQALEYVERPAGHWYRGRCGLAVMPRR